MATFTTKFFDSHTGQEITNPRELDAHDTYSRSVCDDDNSLVFINVRGTSEYAHCQGGHRWQQSFDGAWLSR